RVTQRIAPVDLPTADRGQSRRTLGLESRSAIAQLKRLGGVPIAALIIQMGKFVNQCGLQLGIQIGVGSAGQSGGFRFQQLVEKASVQQNAVGTAGATHYLLRQAIAPADLNSTVQLLAHARGQRSEEHTSELQSRENLVCRLLLEKKKLIH